MHESADNRLSKKGFLAWIAESEAFAPEEKPRLAELVRALERELSEARRRHVCSVALTGDELAQRFGVDRTRVLLASLGHDLAKERTDLSVEEWREFAPAQIDAGVLAVPALHHAALGVVVMVNDYGVEDPLVLSAIRYHSTGCAGLSPVGRVLFVADYIEPLRRYAGRAQVEAACAGSLETGCLEVLRSKLVYLLARNRRIHRASWEFWNELVSLGAENHAQEE